MNIDSPEIGLKEKNPYWGVLGDGSTDKEYQLAAGELDLPTPRNNFYDHKIEYQQTEVSPVSCTLHGAIGAVSDLTGYRFTLEQRKEMWREAIRLGAKEGWGWYVSSAVDLVRKYASKVIGEELVTFVLDIGSDEYSDVIDLGYTVVSSFQGNKKYGEDKADGVLDGTYFGKSTYGHCIRNVKTPTKDPYDVLVDNYIVTKKEANRYKVLYDHLDDLIASNVFSRRGYVFAFKKDIEDLQAGRNVPVWALKSIQKAQKAGVLKPSDILTHVVGDPEMERALVALGALSEAQGNLTLLRFIVALDRLGVFKA